MDTSNNDSVFVAVLKAILKSSEESGDKDIPIGKIKSLLDHYSL